MPIRGSGPNTYACPQHPQCLNDQHPEGHFVCQLGEDHEGWHADGSVKWEADWHMSGESDSHLSAEGVIFLPPEEPPAALV